MSEYNADMSPKLHKCVPNFVKSSELVMYVKTTPDFFFLWIIVYHPNFFCFVFYYLLSLRENLSGTCFYACHLSLTHVWGLTTQCVVSWIKTSCSGTSEVHSTGPNVDVSQMATTLNIRSIFWSSDYDKVKSSPCRSHEGIRGSEGIDVKTKFTLEQATKAQRRSRGITLLFFNLGSRWGGWSTPLPGRFTSGKSPVPIA
jgi:hypothetical protein